MFGVAYGNTSTDPARYVRRAIAIRRLVHSCMKGPSFAT
jgi:hypothetical protein